MAIVRDDAVGGALNVSISDTDNTIDSDGLADLSEVTTGDYAILVLFEQDNNNRVLKYEVLHITDHTAGATTATVERGKHGTVAQTWEVNAIWAHSLTVLEFNDVEAHTTNQTNPHGVTYTQAGAEPEGAVADHEALADPHTQYQLESEKGTVGGYASLDGNGYVPEAELPPLAVGETFSVASESEMLSLNAQLGDVAIRTDTETRWLLVDEDPSVLSNWRELDFPDNVVETATGGTGIDVAGTANIEIALDSATQQKHTDYDNHLANTSNPHSVTALQAGAVPDTGGTFTGDLSVDFGFAGSSQVVRQIPWTGSSTETILLLGRLDTSSQRLEARFIGHRSSLSSVYTHLIIDILFAANSASPPNYGASISVSGFSHGLDTPYLVTCDYDASTWLGIAFVGNTSAHQPHQAHLIGYEEVSDGTIQAVALANVTNVTTYTPDNTFDLQVNTAFINGNQIYTTGNLNPEIYIPRLLNSPSSPATDDLWIDLGHTFEVLRRYDGASWIPLAPTQASHVGAPTQSEFDSHAARHEPFGSDYVSYRLSNNYQSVDADPVNWPDGISTMYSSNSTENPDGVSGGILSTFITGASVGFQIFSPRYSSNYFYTRSWNDSGEVWSSWQRLVNKSEFDIHTGNTSNPHSVTATQAGAVPDTGGTFTGLLTLGDGTLADGVSILDFAAHRSFSVRRRGAIAGSANLSFESELGDNSWQFAHNGARIIEFNTNGNVYIDNNLTVGIDVQIDGLLGIGTTSPEKSLDIQGDARVRQENSLYFGGNGPADSAFAVQYNKNLGSLDFKALV